MRFLIADDDQLCRHLLREILEPYADCEFAKDGIEAVEAVRKANAEGRPYDLLCLDIMMPYSDGHQVLKTIRREEQERGASQEEALKIVMTTTLSDRASISTSVVEGCQCYIPKPIDQEMLLEELQVMGLIQKKEGEITPPANDPPLSKKDEAQPDDAQPLKHNGNQKKFLIVDDDVLCRELLRQILAPYGDCDMAVNGVEGVNAMRLAMEDQAPYDLICLDIMMPEMNGHQTLEGLREIEREFGIFGLDQTKVIMTTALRDAKHCVQSFREGCESYLTKPIDVSELLSQLHKLDVISATEDLESLQKEGSI